MAILKLFVELGKGALFHYFNNPLRRFVKTDDKGAVGLSGSTQVHPHVLIFEDDTKPTKTRKKEELKRGQFDHAEENKDR